jgi:AcrR family transcriptional regulator
MPSTDSDARSTKERDRPSAGEGSASHVDRSPFSRRGSARRTELLDAAVRVIGRIGARAVRVEDVAQEASVSTPLVYYYFSNRTELMAEAFRHANLHLLATPSDDEGLNGRERVLRRLLRDIGEDPDAIQAWVLWNELVGAAVFDSSLRKPINDGYQAWVDQVAGLIRIGQRDGSVAAAVDAFRAAETLTSMMDGLSARSILGGITVQRAEELARECVDGVLRTPAN